MKKKHVKKICLISLSAYPLFNPTVKATFGGAEVQLYLIARALAKQFKVNFIVGHYHQKKCEVIDDVQLVRSISLDNSQNLFMRIIKAVVFLLDLIKVNADIYINRSASMGTGLISLYCKLFRKKFIYMVAHEIDCSGAYKKESGFFKGFLYELGIKNANKVISQTDNQKDMLSATYRLNSITIPSVYHIPDYIEHRDYKDKPILWVGRCEEWKRPEVFIRLARKIPDKEFIMIMPKANNSDYINFFTESSKNIPSNLKIVDFVPFNSINHYFESSCLFVNTSVYEGFPNTFIQSALNGVPIVSLSVDPDDIIKKYEIGKYCYCDEENLVRLICSLLSNEHEYYKCSKNCYNYAKKNHDIKKNVNKIEMLINELTPTY